MGESEAGELLAELLGSSCVPPPVLPGPEPGGTFTVPLLDNPRPIWAGWTAKHLPPPCGATARFRTGAPPARAEGLESERRAARTSRTKWRGFVKMLSCECAGTGRASAMRRMRA